MNLYERRKTMDEKEIPEILKLEVNNLIWMHGKGSLTLNEAEQLAINVCKLIIAIPLNSYPGGDCFVKDILVKNKIGMLAVDKYQENVFEYIHPQLNRGVINIHKFIKPEHKTWAEAGSQHGYYTPFQRTKQNIEYEIKKHPNGILFKDFIKLTEHHYSSETTARSCLQKWIEGGIIKGAKITYQNNRLFIYPIVIDKPK